MSDAYSLNEALSALSVGERELRGLVYDGIVRAVRQAPGELRFSKEDVDRLRDAWTAK